MNKDELRELISEEIETLKVQVFPRKIEDNLLESMKDRFYLLENITDAKIKSELNKIDYSRVNKADWIEIFEQFDIANLKGVVK